MRRHDSREHQSESLVLLYTLIRVHTHPRLS